MDKMSKSPIGARSALWIAVVALLSAACSNDRHVSWSEGNSCAAACLELGEHTRESLFCVFALDRDTHEPIDDICNVDHDGTGLCATLDELPEGVTGICAPDATGHDDGYSGDDDGGGDDEERPPQDCRENGTYFITTDDLPGDYEPAEPDPGITGTALCAIAEVPGVTLGRCVGAMDEGGAGLYCEREPIPTGGAAGAFCECSEE